MDELSIIELTQMGNTCGSLLNGRSQHNILTIRYFYFNKLIVDIWFFNYQMSTCIEVEIRIRFPSKIT
jgi:hypothetical protein